MGIDSRTAAAVLGLLAVAIFLAALLVFGFANPDFNLWDDFVSRLGAKGAPHALAWNVIGFALVGILLFAFGLSYGLLLGDRPLAIFLSLFGLGFAFVASPMDFADAEVSKAHILAVCLGLACWMFGLSRMGSNRTLAQKVRTRANITACLILVSMLGFVFGAWSMPLAHRLVFGIGFGWTAITSLELLLSTPSPEQKRPQ